MNRLARITLGVLLLAPQLPSAASAQANVARYATQRNRVFASFGLDPAFVASVGYGRVIPVAGHAFELVGEAGLVTAHLDTHDFRVRLGTQTSLLRWRALNVTGNATFVTRGTSNSIYRALDMGADITGTVGVYRSGWFAAAEVGKDKAIITHLTNSDWYRELYPDARDGWYLDNGGIIHSGLVAGVALGRAELSGRIGIRRTEHLHDVTPPMYASLGLGFGF